MRQEPPDLLRGPMSISTRVEILRLPVCARKNFFFGANVMIFRTVIFALFLDSLAAAKPLERIQASFQLAEISADDKKYTLLFQCLQRPLINANMQEHEL